MNKTKRSHSILLYTCNSATGFKFWAFTRFALETCSFFFLLFFLSVWCVFFWSMLLLRLLLVFVARLRISNQQFYTKTNRHRPQTNKLTTKQRKLVQSNKFQNSITFFKRHNFVHRISIWFLTTIVWLSDIDVTLSQTLWFIWFAIIRNENEDE